MDIFKKFLKVALILISLIGLIIPDFIVNLAPEFWCANYDGYVVVRITSVVILILVFITHIFKKENIVPVLKFISIPLLTILVLSGTGFGIYKAIDSNTLPKCDSKWAMEEARTIFGQYNSYYNNILKYGYNVELSIKNPEPVSYDKETGRYECRADMVITSKDGSSFPNETYVNDNVLRYKRRGVVKATARINYSIFKSEGENTVRATTDSDRSDFWDFEYHK